MYYLAGLVGGSGHLLFDEPTGMEAAFTSIQTDALAALGTIAPIAIGIFAAFFLWKIGKKFFSSVAK